MSSCEGWLKGVDVEDLSDTGFFSDNLEERSG